MTGDSSSDVGLKPGGIVKHGDREIGRLAGDIDLYLAAFDPAVWRAPRPDFSLLPFSPFRTPFPPWKTSKRSSEGEESESGSCSLLFWRSEVESSSISDRESGEESEARRSRVSVDYRVFVGGILGIWPMGILGILLSLDCVFWLRLSGWLGNWSLGTRLTCTLHWWAMEWRKCPFGFFLYGAGIIWNLDSWHKSQSKNYNYRGMHRDVNGHLNVKNIISILWILI